MGKASSLNVYVGHVTRRYVATGGETEGESGVALGPLDYDHAWWNTLHCKVVDGESDDEELSEVEEEAAASGIGLPVTHRTENPTGARKWVPSRGLSASQRNSGRAIPDTTRLRDPESLAPEPRPPIGDEEGDEDGCLRVFEGGSIGWASDTQPAAKPFHWFHPGPAPGERAAKTDAERTGSSVPSSRFCLEAEAEPLESTEERSCESKQEKGTEVAGEAHPEWRAEPEDPGDLKHTTPTSPDEKSHGLSDTSPSSPPVPWAGSASTSTRSSEFR
ncbi:unnamed protein product [Durusdinium trenchii]|uniref:Uncharacterized protein n=1 Tax=Durusdinium trenchii TaxID=1381693 RepID=A0ABP0SPH8_9DINO